MPDEGASPGQLGTRNVVPSLATWICIVLRYICRRRDNPSARFGVYFYWMTRSIG